jgi:two-component system, NtrC family, response regulator
MSKILIIDDDPSMCRMLIRLVEMHGHHAVAAQTLSHGLREAREAPYDVVFLDVRMPDGNGLQALQEVQAGPGKPEVIIITGMGDADGAELAIKSGAWDYVEKARSVKEMSLPLVRALQYRQEKLTKQRPVALDRVGIVGETPEILECLQLVAAAAVTDSNVLITGETGTGKELFARAIHENSPRKGGGFVVVDCGALPESLVESVLFGSEKGAFTGADRAREGLVRQAHGGTLFLDEVGELPPAVQKAFLRVLQEHRFRPVGGRKEVESDFRLVAATNRNLDDMVGGNRFRQDLLFRLRSVTISLPPLRERSGDIRSMAMNYVTRQCERYNREAKGFSPEFLNALVEYDWPGNVRELLNTLEGALAVAGTEPILFEKHLPTNIRVRIVRSAFEQESGASGSGSDTFPRFREYREEMERRYLSDLMARANNDIKEACSLSGLSRSRLYELLKRCEPG